MVRKFHFWFRFRQFHRKASGEILNSFDFNYQDFLLTAADELNKRENIRTNSIDEALIMMEIVWQFIACQQQLSIDIETKIKCTRKCRSLLNEFTKRLP